MIRTSIEIASVPFRFPQRFTSQSSPPQPEPKSDTEQKSQKTPPGKQRSLPPPALQENSTTPDRHRAYPSPSPWPQASRATTPPQSPRDATTSAATQNTSSSSRRFHHDRILTASSVCFDANLRTNRTSKFKIRLKSAQSC